MWCYIIARDITISNKICLDITGFHFHIPENDSCLPYDRVRAVMLSAVARETVTNISMTSSSPLSSEWSIHNSMLFASQVVTTIGKSCGIRDVISQSRERQQGSPDSKVHGAIMGPNWALSAPDGSHVGPMDLAIRGLSLYILNDTIFLTIA